MLHNATTLNHMLNQYRVAWMGGGYGTGKTLLCFQLAYELVLSGRYRYILSNCNSVWTDSPENVKVRDDIFVDAVVILDEAALFLAMRSDAKKFLIGLRKLNITILCPSVLDLPTVLKTLQINRTLNLTRVGFPYWRYEYRLVSGSVKEKGNFGIFKPQQIYGIYDTLDYPVDDCYLSEWFQYWMENAKDSRPDWVTWGHPPDHKPEGYTGTQGENSDLVELGRQLEETQQEVSSLQDALSVSSFERSEKKRRFKL